MLFAVDFYKDFIDVEGRQYVYGMDIVWSQVALNCLESYCVTSYSAGRNEMERNIRK